MTIWCQITGKKTQRKERDRVSRQYIHKLKSKSQPLEYVTQTIHPMLLEQIP